MRKLQDVLDQIPYEDLPPAWTTFDLAGFSRDKRLWDYQQAALRHALKALWKYYEDLADFRPRETIEANAERKHLLAQWYRDNGLDIDQDIPLGRRRDVARLLEAHYPVQDGRVAYEQFVNRIGFWMATGSGKTLVLVKLIELLWHLIRRGEIPAHDVLFLSHRDDLLGQLRDHVDDFNAARGDFFIRLRELREYPDAKRSASSLFREREATIFFYRSDNLSDEQKEKIVDFRNYDDQGRWYVLLDEAHKGDREDSKRQHIYSILARNGFLFNFSATFTDPRDVATTAFDFNLARFIEAGYGKHISILKQENRAFREGEDYTGAEKQKVVLKALVMLAYAHEAYHALQATAVPYHKPLLLTLVNSVNTRDADLKLFFRELLRIGQGQVPETTWQEAKQELWQELRTWPPFMFQNERFHANEPLFQSLTLADVLLSVFNATSTGQIEVLTRPSNRQELAFKLKTADRPFALIRIGDISGWLKEELAGYEVNERFDDEGYFERINHDDSDINILMGSRTFYEGWDSNRPNVITYINIGTGTDARKFILQSVGRGVRIEPLKGQRKRLLALYNAKAVDEEQFRQARAHAQALETLFIFGTNRDALHTVIKELDKTQGPKEQELALAVNEETVQGRTLLIPVYREAARPLVEQRDLAKFSIVPEELGLLKRYVDYLGDDRLLLAVHGMSPREIGLLHRILSEPQAHFKTDDARQYGTLDLIVSRLRGYLRLIPQELDQLKPLEDEIRHFRHIKVALEDITELTQRIQAAGQYPSRIAELRARYEARQLSFDEMLVQVQGVQRTARWRDLDIRHVANHYYVPVILSHDERVDYIQHIIRHPSEVRFLNDLERYLEQANHRFSQFDWWLFSKLDESLDEVYLPYYDPDANRIRHYNPDFVFWLQRGQDYFIIFVDPKGVQHTGYQHKLAGYREIFENGTLPGAARQFQHNDLTVRVYLCFYTTDTARVQLAEIRRYWADSIDGMLAHITEAA
ncbi:MAG: DEAD/DEAH box helicase family protein [Anaerolineae bacterium]